MSEFRTRHYSKTLPTPRGGVKPNRDKYYKKENAKPSPVKIIPIDEYLKMLNSGIPRNRSGKRRA